MNVIPMMPRNPLGGPVAHFCRAVKDLGGFDLCVWGDATFTTGFMVNVPNLRAVRESILAAQRAGERE